MLKKVVAKEKDATRTKIEMAKKKVMKATVVGIFSVVFDDCYVSGENLSMTLL